MIYRKLNITLKAFLLLQFVFISSSCATSNKVQNKNMDFDIKSFFKKMIKKCTSNNNIKTSLIAKEKKKENISSNTKSEKLKWSKKDDLKLKKNLKILDKLIQNEKNKLNIDILISKIKTENNDNINELIKNIKKNIKILDSKNNLISNLDPKNNKEYLENILELLNLYSDNFKINNIKETELKILKSHNLSSEQISHGILLTINNHLSQYKKDKITKKSKKEIDTKQIIGYINGYYRKVNEYISKASKKILNKIVIGKKAGEKLYFLKNLAEIICLVNKYISCNYLTNKELLNSTSLNINSYLNQISSDEKGGFKLNEISKKVDFLNKYFINKSKETNQICNKIQNLISKNLRFRFINYIYKIDKKFQVNNNISN